MPARKACDVCSKRKIRCILPRSGSSCDWCKNQGLECTFKREAKSSHRLTPAVVQHLLRRLDHLEGKQAENKQKRSLTLAISEESMHSADRNGIPLQSMRSDKVAQANSAPDNATQCTQSSRHYRSEDAVKRWLGHSWYFKGLSVFSADGEKWLASKTGQTFTFKSLSLLNPPCTARGLPTSNQEATVLPKEFETRSIAREYFQSRAYHTDPILDPVLFNETIRIAHDVRTDAASRKSAAACIWALHALMSRRNAKDSGAYAMSQLYERRCLSQLDLISDEPDVDHLQALLLLYLLEPCSPHHYTRLRLLFLACNMIIDLDGHRTSRTDEDSNEYLRRHLRGLFWHCYRLDKDAALRQGRPPILTQDHCDLAIPDDHGDPWLLPANYAASMMIPYLSAACRLSIIKENVCRLLLSPSATNMDDNIILLNIRHLDEELERWRVALPHSIQPTLAISSDHTTASAYFGSRREHWSLVLQLDYSYTLIMIHTAIRKCHKAGAEPGSLSEDLHQVVHSSINVSLEAARSMLHLLRIATGIMEIDALYYVVRYVPLAAMALFMNVVIHPLDSRAPADLVILTTFTGAVQGLDLNGANDEDVDDIQRLCEFMVELARLGNSAIWKAKIAARK